MGTRIELARELLGDAEHLLKQGRLRSATLRMIADLRQLFPDAEFLIQGETYGTAEDIIVKVFVRDDNRITEISRKAHELSLNYELETGYFIMPMTLPIRCSPIKYEARPLPADAPDAS